MWMRFWCGCWYENQHLWVQGVGICFGWWWWRCDEGEWMFRQFAHSLSVHWQRGPCCSWVRSSSSLPSPAGRRCCYRARKVGYSSVKRKRGKNRDIQRAVIEKRWRVDDVGIELHIPAEWTERTAEWVEIERWSAIHNNKCGCEENVVDRTGKLSESPSSLTIILTEWMYPCFEFLL